MWAGLNIVEWRHNNRQRIVGELRKDLTDAGDKSSLVTSGIVGKTAEKGLENLAHFEEFVNGFRWH